VDSEPDPVRASVSSGSSRVSPSGDEPSSWHRVRSNLSPNTSSGTGTPVLESDSSGHGFRCLARAQWLLVMKHIACLFIYLFYVQVKLIYVCTTWHVCSHDFHLMYSIHSVFCLIYTRSFLPLFKFFQRLSAERRAGHGAV
jgi:hypothetical protein